MYVSPVSCSRSNTGQRKFASHKPTFYPSLQPTGDYRYTFIIIIIIIGFSVYLHHSPGDITQFNNKSMQKTEKKVLSCRLKLAVLVMD